MANPFVEHPLPWRVDRSALKFGVVIVLDANGENVFSMFTRDTNPETADFIVAAVQTSARASK
jgi:hypothetical protein